MGPRRSLLLVPGSRPDRIAKALAVGADMVCVDLEDAVASGDKAEARAFAMQFLVAAEPVDQGKPERIVRLNSLRTMTGLRDLLALLKAVPTQGLVMLPKVESADEVRWIDGLMAEQGLGCGLIALIETVTGLECASAIAKSTPRLQSLMFGGVTMAAQLGVALADAPLLYARGRIVHAAAQTGIGVIDVPTQEAFDLTVSADEAKRALQLGFTGKACIHPEHIATINAVFTPTEDDIARARLIDGRLVGKPMAQAAERVLIRSGIKA